VNARAGAALVEKLAADPELAAEAAELLTREVRTAPTLVKYAQASEYELRTRAELTEAAQEFFHGLTHYEPPVVDLVERTETLEVEIASTLFYSVSSYSYRQIRDLVADLPEARVNEIVELGLRHRGKHDELPRAYQAGAALRFDIAMDIGGFRDMHRHRRCVQILQPFTPNLGWETPDGKGLGGKANHPFRDDAWIEYKSDEDWSNAGYNGAIRLAHSASRQIGAGKAPEAAQAALYLLPLATRCRSLFKMDFAEAQYISELRSGPAGHFSYRRVAWEMYLALQRQHAELARHIRVTDFTQPIDLLQR
ncbi:MAG: FAD-dependent thymidylate synthase, partial [Terracidiphilus sp.]